ncbi:TIM44-like domain-containing protein [Desulfovibrio sp. OttesenSCG-928-I05]|nr:TIM44-like domain-containing protein [Desulfovibrio sp. OttesenSCG-928-I05]
MKGPVTFLLFLTAFPHGAGAAVGGDFGAPGAESSGFFDGSLIGSIFFGTEYTGVSVADILVFAVLAFLLLSVLRVSSGKGGKGAGDAPPRQEPPRPTLPRREGASSAHDPWARLRSKDVSSPPSAPGPGQSSGELSGPNQGSRSQNTYQDQGSPRNVGTGETQGAEAPAVSPAATAQGGAEYSPATLKLRKDFDLEDFLKGARILFARLQESFDRRDFEDIALFATPEVVDAMRDQAEKEGAPSKTAILLVKANLITLNIEDGQEVAEVFFDVLLREGSAAGPSQVKEVWYFVHPVDGGYWQLDGIRQVE